MDACPYRAEGYRSRADYLSQLAEEFGPAVHVLAAVLGPSEDFDGLLIALEDAAEDGELSFA